LPALLVSVLLYASAAVWILLAILRNLKKEMEDMRLLSRWQAIAMTAHLNILAIGLVDMRHLLSTMGSAHEVARSVTAGYLFLNYCLLYLVGFSMLSSSQRLRAWWHRCGSDANRHWSDDAPPLFWMVAAAITAFAVYELAVLGWSRALPVSTWAVPIVPMFVVLAHVAKDVMFLQWCATTRLKRPLLKGIMFLGLYYFAVVVLGITLLREGRQESVIAFFTPLLSFFDQFDKHRMASAYGAELQMAVALFLLLWTEQRLARPARIMPSGETAAA
jgi:hypothetical protein